MTLRGKVTVKPFGKGSKSAHDAVYFQTGQGEYVLKRSEDNPFENNTLHALVGKQVEATGVIKEYLFIVEMIKVL